MESDSVTYNVQWQPSKAEDVKEIARRQFIPFLNWTDIHDPPFAVSLCLTIILSLVFEHYYSNGSITLIIGVLFTILNAVRAKAHDNIPTSHNPFRTIWFPFFGHTLNSLFHWNDFYDEALRQTLIAQTDRMFSVELFLRQSYVGVLNPNEIEYLFRTKFGDTEKGDTLNTGLKPMLGNGIFTTDGDLWRTHRTVASRIFTVRSLRDYMFQVFNETTDRFMDKLDELRFGGNNNSENNNGDNIIDIYDMFNRLTLEAFTQAAFGVKIGCIDIAPKKLQFAQSFDRGFQICTRRFFDPSWKILNFFNIGYERELSYHTKIVNNFVNNIIAQRIGALHSQTRLNIDNSPKTGSINIENKDVSEAGGVRSIKESKFEYRALNENEATDSETVIAPKMIPNTEIIEKKLFAKYDLLSLFLKDNSKMTHKQLRDTAMAFIIAGRDTTAQLLSWFTYRVSMPENEWVIDRILKEISEHCTINESNSNLVEFDYNVINKLKFLENSLLESLRLHPSVPHLVKYARNDIKVPLMKSYVKDPKDSIAAIKRGYYVIRKGDGIVIPCYAMNRLPWLWENPLKFDPTRFENKKYDANYLCSFNVQPRLCLGKNVALMEAKIAVVRLLTKYKVKPIKNQNVTYEFSVTNQMKYGFKIQLENRPLNEWYHGSNMAGQSK